MTRKSSLSCCGEAEHTSL